MRDHRPRTTQSLLEDNGKLNVAQRAIELSKLNQQILALIPGEPARVCRVANYRDGVLVLEAGTAAWAMRLNYERHQLMSVLRQNGLSNLVTIEVKVNPDLAKAPRQETADTQDDMVAHRRISPTAASYLSMLSEGAPPKVKAKLEAIARLASHTDTKKPE